MGKTADREPWWSQLFDVAVVAGAGYLGVRYLYRHNAGAAAILQKALGPDDAEKLFPA